MLDENSPDSPVKFDSPYLHDLSESKPKLSYFDYVSYNEVTTRYVLNFISEILDRNKQIPKNAKLITDSNKWETKEPDIK